MNNVDKQYLELLKEVKEKGIKKSDRTGTGTVSLFGKTLRFNMREGFPALTTKKIHFRSIIHELLWFLQGSHNIKYLVDNGVSIWNEWPWQNYMKEHENRKLMLKIAMDKADIYDDTPFAVKNMKDRLDQHPPLTLDEFVAKIKESQLSPKYSASFFSDEKTFSDEWGELGPVYGKQWRQWQGWMDYGNEGKKGSLWYDQILKLVQDLKTNPDSRRLMVNAWNVAEIDQMLLPPCHYGFQCWTRELTIKERWELLKQKVGEVQFKSMTDSIVPFGGGLSEELKLHEIPERALSLMWQQRSCDIFLGIPYNIASYGLLLHMLAQSVNMVAEELIGNFGDCHLYLNHIEQAEEQLKREPLELCKLLLTKPKDSLSSLYGNNGHILEYEYESFKFEGYKSHPSIKAPIAI